MIVGIGIDVAEVEHIKKAVTQTRGRFLSRVFTEAEINYCERMRDRYLCLAHHFAVKEAVIKALGLSGLNVATWREIETQYRSDCHTPTLSLHGKVRQVLQTIGGNESFVSITHNGRLAIALVVLCSEKRDRKSEKYQRQSDALMSQHQSNINSD